MLACVCVCPQGRRMLRMSSQRGGPGGLNLPCVTDIFNLSSRIIIVGKLSQKAAETSRPNPTDPPCARRTELQPVCV